MLKIPVFVRVTATDPTKLDYNFRGYDITHAWPTSAATDRNERDELIKRHQGRSRAARDELARAHRIAIGGSDEASGSSTNSTRRGGRARQAAPFAKDRPQGHGGRPGRRAGPTYGRRGRRPIPARVDETYAAPLPAACPRCGGAIQVTRVGPSTKKTCAMSSPSCGGSTSRSGACRLPAPRAGSTPAANLRGLGRGRRELGPGAVTFTVLLHKHVGVPLDKIATLARPVRADRDAGGLAQVHRAAEWRGPRMRPSADPGESSSVPMKPAARHRVALAVGVRDKTTVYAICPGRGFDDAATILARTSPACWSAMAGRYRRFTGALHQSCPHLPVGVARPSAEPLGEPCRPSSPTPSSAIGGAGDHEHGLDLWPIGACSPASSPAHRRGARKWRPSASPPTGDRECPAVLAFLWAPDVDATNWRAEHADPSRRRQSPDLWRESHAPRRADPTDPRECGPHRASTPRRPQRPLHHVAAGTASDGPRRRSTPRRSSITR